MRRSTIAGIAAVAVALPLLVAGCSSGQSNKDACAQMTISVNAIGTDVTAAQAKLSQGPVVSEKAFDAIATKFHAATQKVTNGDVRAKADVIDSRLTSFMKAINLQNNSPTTAHAKAVQSGSAALQKALGDMGTVCTK